MSCLHPRRACTLRNQSTRTTNSACELKLQANFPSLSLPLSRLALLVAHRRGQSGRAHRRAFLLPLAIFPSAHSDEADLCWQMSGLQSHCVSKSEAQSFESASSLLTSDIYSRRLSCQRPFQIFFHRAGWRQLGAHKTAAALSNEEFN